MALRIFPYKMASDSAKDLAQLLNVLRIKQDGTFVPKHFTQILNWGNSKTPTWATRARERQVTILNKFEAVNLAANKLTALQRMSEAGVKVPQFTTSVATAQQWLREGATVMERHDLRGNSGAGIRIVANNPNEQERGMGVHANITHAPLYTKFINKSTEFRVHVFQGQVIDFVEKKKVAAERRPANFNKYVSSVHQGWVFARTGILLDEDIKIQAIAAVRALGLDFGAVDIVFCDGIGYVLEVNCAPGLAGTTLTCYGNAIRRFMGLAPLPGTNNTVTTNVQPPAPVHAVVQTQAVNTQADMVNVRMSRQLARQLKTLLAEINL